MVYYCSMGLIMPGENHICEGTYFSNEGGFVVPVPEATDYNDVNSLKRQC